MLFLVPHERSTCTRNIFFATVTVVYRTIDVLILIIDFQIQRICFLYLKLLIQVFLNCKKVQFLTMFLLIYFLFSTYRDDQGSDSESDK